MAGLSLGNIAPFRYQRDIRSLTPYCQEKWRLTCFLSTQDVAALGFGGLNTMRTKGLAVQSILGVAENRAKPCQIFGHSPTSHSEIRLTSHVLDPHLPA